MSTHFAFTKTRIAALPPASEGRRKSDYDTDTKSLALRVKAAGTQTFMLYRKINGKPERIKIGTFPQTTVEPARTQPAEVNGAIAKDENPVTVKRAIRQEPTFGELFERFLEEKRNRAGRPLSPKTVTDDRRGTVKRQLGRILDDKLSQVATGRGKTATKRVQLGISGADVLPFKHNSA